jgi:Ca-activated chloride channel homolog
MRFDTPWVLLLLVLTPLVFEHPWRKAVLYFLRIRPGLDAPEAVNFATGFNLSRLPVSWRARWRNAVLSVLKGSAYVCFIVALARPQMGVEFIETETGGRDLMLVLDTSGSMQALDFFLEGKRVRRLDALKSVVREFIGQRLGDRIGLVVFGTDAYTQCPLTLDHMVLGDYVDDLEIGMAGDSTSLGEAIALALKRVKDIPAESKVLVLVTDGKQTSGDIEPLEAAEMAKDLKTKVYSIGIGGNEPVPFKVKTIFGVEALDYQEIPLDEGTLRAVAQKTGGGYFNAKNTEELKQIYDEINKLEERKERIEDSVEYEELFFALAAVGFMFFLIVQILGETVFKTIP